MNLLTKTALFAFLFFSFFAKAQTIPGQIAWWPLNGNFNDSSGNNFNGQSIGSPTSVNDRFNNSGGAMSFNGVSQMAKFGDILDSVFCKTPTAKFSITGWAKSSAITPNFGAGVIIGKLAGANGPDQWSINHFNDSTVRGIVKTSSLLDYVEWRSPSKIAPNQWFFFTLMFDGSVSNANDRVIFYVNGSPTTFSRSNGTFGSNCVNTNQEITIGAGHAANSPNTPNNHFIGDIDDIRIFNRVLTLSEINSIYTTPNVSVDEYATTGNYYAHLIGENPSKSNTFFISVEEPVTFQLYDNLGKLISIGKSDSKEFSVTVEKMGVSYLMILNEKGIKNTIKLVRY